MKTQRHKKNDRPIFLQAFIIRGEASKIEEIADFIEKNAELLYGTTTTPDHRLEVVKKQNRGGE